MSGIVAAEHGRITAQHYGCFKTGSDPLRTLPFSEEKASSKGSDPDLKSTVVQNQQQQSAIVCFENASDH
jgi:hypothetical protein